MATVAEHLEYNRKELLDLSTRNRLLSIPKASKSARLIHVVDERSDQVFRMLTQQRKEMSFLAGRPSAKPGTSDGDDEDSHLFELAQPEDDNDTECVIAKRHSDSRLQTQLTPEGLQRRLLGLQTDARTIQEEQGVNVLYLALGQLKWLETPFEDGARFAPLLLLPVELVRKTASDRFKIRWTEAEIQENLSLSEKLRADFDLKLPDFGDLEDFDPVAYFAAVTSCVKSRPGWEVLPHDITLGFFSFAKLMMFLDLDPERWPDDKKIDENPLVSGLLADGFASEPLPFDDSTDLDSHIPVERLDHVVDADGSQTIAIELIRRGRNLVVQGPPGTGKSQTICNIIASAVLDGKKVLFVAEKLAALEVVKRRLEMRDLGAICLELHSNKANKRTILEEIQRTWQLGRPVTGRQAEAFATLEKLRARLNSHCALVHEAIEPSGTTLYRTLGCLAKLRDNAAIYADLDLPGAEQWSRETVAGVRRSCVEFADRIAILGSPVGSPWRGTRRKSFLRIDAEPLMRKIRRLREELAALQSAARATTDFFERPQPVTCAEVLGPLLMADHIAAAPELDRGTICHSVWNAGLSALQDIISQGRQFVASRAALSEKVKPDVWSKDSAAVRDQIAIRGRSLLRLIKREYRDAFVEFRNILSVDPPNDHTARLALLDEIIATQRLYRKIEEHDLVGTAAFGSLWRKHNSDWGGLEEVVIWVDAHSRAGLGAPFRELHSRVENNSDVQTLADNMRLRLREFVATFDVMRTELDLDLEIAFGTGQLYAVRWEELDARVESWLQSIDGLTEWIAYYSRAEALRDAGAACLVTAVESASIPVAELVSAFDWAFHSQLLRDIVRRHPEIGSFDGLLHEHAIDEFRGADRERLEIAKLRVLLSHYECMPHEGDGVGMTGIIKAEIARKRRHMPIRKLLCEAGRGIQAIKPVFMMSPLSVAQFLTPGDVEFDLLVIDEASQVEPVDALGAIARCRQVVVVGDSRQLPPSRFFMRATSDDTDEDFEGREIGAAAKDIESILGLCLARGFPQRMLRWHYRSRHHSLIAVSNHEFYDNHLYIVPSPQRPDSDLGLHFNHIPDGIFDAGKTAVNQLEAHTVARAVMAHAENHPDTTLGVAAFSIRQRQAIQDELEALRRERPDLESYFNAHPHEPFFTKNLENVQGDERDVIFISIGYGRNESGYMAMRFGPLSNDGGERRLNVLISRAKKRCEVFSSIRSEDIDLNRATGRGVAALKSFLRFAETGRMGIAKTAGRECDSPFEEAVQSELEKHGLKIDPQVGEAGFFIDLAVRDESTGAYILGIECDGAAYHSSRSARDRDRLRQAVLEDHGWVIHRIWSTDWFQRPDRELRRTLDAVEKARDFARRGQPAPRHVAGGKGGVDPRSEPLHRVADEDIEADPYILAELDVPFNIDLQGMAPGQVVRHVKRVLEVEAPVHLDEVVLRIRSAFGYERAGSRIHKLVAKAARLAVANSEFASEEGFYVNRSQPVKPRRRDESLPSSIRKPDNLPPQEIRAAIVLMIERHLGVETGELSVAVGRLLGFRATSPQLRSIVEAQVRKLVRGGVLLQTDGLLQRVSSANPSMTVN